MNQKITSFYRLTEQEKDRLVEQCREEIQARKVREIEETRKILEELLTAEYENRPMTSQEEMQEILDGLQNQLKASEEQRETLQSTLTQLQQDYGIVKYSENLWWRKMLKLEKKLPLIRFCSGLAGCLAGMILAAVIIVYAVTVRCFPDSGIYCGLQVLYQPWGPGVYTYSDGERSFGFWDYAEDMEYVMNNETYCYVGMLRSGQPHGYGVLEDSAGNRCFAGEFSEGMTIRGEWLPEDETSSDDNAEVSEGQENKGNEKG